MRCIISCKGVVIWMKASYQRNFCGIMSRVQQKVQVPVQSPTSSASYWFDAHIVAALWWWWWYWCISNVRYGYFQILLHVNIAEYCYWHILLLLLVHPEHPFVVAGYCYWHILLLVHPGIPYSSCQILLLAYIVIVIGSPRHPLVVAGYCYWQRPHHSSLELTWLDLTARLPAPYPSLKTPVRPLFPLIDRCQNEL